MSVEQVESMAADILKARFETSPAADAPVQVRAQAPARVPTDASPSRQSKRRRVAGHDGNGNGNGNGNDMGNAGAAPAATAVAAIGSPRPASVQHPQAWSRTRDQPFSPQAERLELAILLQAAVPEGNLAAWFKRTAAKVGALPEAERPGCLMALADVLPHFQSDPPAQCVALTQLRQAGQGFHGRDRAAFVSLLTAAVAGLASARLVDA